MVVIEGGGMKPNPAEHYLSQLQALLPEGAAWSREPDATLTSVLTALAEEFARLDGNAVSLLDEADPRTTLDLLPEWERAFGLPDECADQVDTLAERREALTEKVTRIGNQSRQYYIDIASRLGYEVTITEFRGHTVLNAVNDPLYSIDWIFTWRVNAPEETVRNFTVVSGVNEPLADWGNEILECAIERVKPAHTNVLFAYGG